MRTPMIMSIEPEIRRGLSLDKILRNFANVEAQKNKFILANAFSYHRLQQPEAGLRSRN